MLEAIEATLHARGAVVRRGGDYERWDLEVRRGTFGALRLLMAVEEHGAGHQLARLRFWPKFSSLGSLLSLLFACLSAGAALSDAWGAAGILAAVAIFIAIRAFRDCAAAMAAVMQTIKRLRGEET
jgi:hypothetical protein